MSASSGSPNFKKSARLKRKRTTRACDQCHKSSCKCTMSENGASCVHCTGLAIACTYNRPAKRRGPQPGRALETCRDQGAAGTQHPWSTHPLGIAGIQDNEEQGISFSPSVTLDLDIYSTYETIITPHAIESLADVFYHIVYPILPYFHWPTFRSQIQYQFYRTDVAFFAVTMALCSAAAKRLCAGVPSNLFPAEVLALDATALASNCYDAALASLPSSLTTTLDSYQLMKAKALLSSACFQGGNLTDGMLHLGDYVSLSTSTRFHTEESWPVGLTETEKQERRRLFWGAYQQEQYIAINLGTMSRLRDIKANVLYPAEVFDDMDISETEVRVRSENLKVSFLQGWNFCTDLYRLIDHTDAMIRLRSQSPKEERSDTIASFLSRQNDPSDFATKSLSLVSRLHAKLPKELKKVTAITGNAHMDRLGFVGASNVLITTQTLKMILVGMESSSVHQRCAVASELLDELSSVPLDLFRASSTCSLRHLAHVGYLLGSIIFNPLSAWAYFQIRSILHALVSILENLQTGRPYSSDITAVLKAQIGQIDQRRVDGTFSTTTHSMNQTSRENLDLSFEKAVNCCRGASTPNGKAQNDNDFVVGSSPQDNYFMSNDPYGMLPKSFFNPQQPLFHQSQMTFGNSSIIDETLDDLLF